MNKKNPTIAVALEGTIGFAPWIDKVYSRDILKID